MPAYKQMGSIPIKRHIKHERDTGESFLNQGLYYEHVTTMAGFDQGYSISYHLRPPTRVKEINSFGEIDLSCRETALRPHHIQTQQLERSGESILGRVPLFKNNDILVSRAQPDKQQQHIYRNAGATEIIFITQGSGHIESMFGTLPYKQYDYIVIPQGTAYLIKSNKIEDESHLIIETPSLVQLPQRYLNPQGQLKLGAPFYERDIHGPSEALCVDQDEECTILCKQDTLINEIIMAHHPFDVVGWDGVVYPYTINALDFEPITGTVHQPPPIHQFFEASGFVVCTFVPRHLDLHKQAIKVPYAHSNVQMDELLYYVDGNFSSRKGISSGSVTMHPRGLTHGPHPGTITKSESETFVNELAVMIDTVQPLQLCEAALSIADPNYPVSWMENS